MADIRKTDNPRTEIVTLKLTKAEVATLQRLAQANFRTAGDQLRFLIAEAVRALDAGAS